MSTGLSSGARAPYLQRFSEIAPGPTWLSPARQGALAAFLERGWPDKKEEDWRFTDLAPITTQAVLPGIAARSPDAAIGLDPSLFDDQLVQLLRAAGPRLLFADGRGAGPDPFRDDRPAPPPGLRLEQLSAPHAGEVPGLRAHLGHYLGHGNAFVALNTAFMSDGAIRHIPPGLACDSPITVVYLASAEEAASFPRTVVLAGAGSEATVVEVYLGARGRATLSVSATEIVLEPEARLVYHAIQQSSPQGCHVGHVAVTQASGSRFSAHSLALDGRIVRHDIHDLLAGEGCACNLDGIYLVSGQSHVDNQTTIDHSMPRSTSRESYRGAVAGNGHAVFSGRIVVRPGAAKTDAEQTNRNLLLSSQARINSKPQLEILTSDVKCSHGATTGRLDPEALFYLRSRGISARDASHILIRAFLQQGLERVSSNAVRAELESVLDRRIDSLMAESASP